MGPPRGSCPAPNSPPVSSMSTPERGGEGLPVAGDCNDVLVPRQQPRSRCSELSVEGRVITQLPVDRIRILLDSRARRGCTRSASAIRFRSDACNRSISRPPAIRSWSSSLVTSSRGQFRAYRSVFQHHEAVSHGVRVRHVVRDQDHGDPSIAQPPGRGGGRSPTSRTPSAEVGSSRMSDGSAEVQCSGDGQRLTFATGERAHGLGGVPHGRCPCRRSAVVG